MVAFPFEKITILNNNWSDVSLEKVQSNKTIQIDIFI